MGFHEVQFPTGISYGSRGGPGYSTTVIESEGGAEQRIARQSAAKRTYNAKFGIKSHSDLREVLSFYLVRLGCAYGFRFKDHLDFTTAADGVSAPSPTDQNIGTGNGSNTTFQLRKVYTSGAYSILRNLTKPVAGTTRVAINGTEQLSGFSVDTTLGIVTFTSPPANLALVTAGCQFDVPVRFSSEVDQALQASMDDYDQGNIPDIPLVEILDPAPIPSLSSVTGGAYEVCPTAPQAITLASRLWVISTQFVDECVLPSTSDVPMGGPIFYIYNAGPNSLTIKLNDGATTLISVGVDEVAELLLTKDSGGTKIWIAI